MLKHKLLINLCLLGLFGLGACYSPPEFPLEPTIAYNNVEFKEVPNSLDSLIISIKFQDGDGDLGLDANETQVPYNDVWYINIGSEETPVPLSYSNRFEPPWDTLPPYEFPYTCTNYTTNHGFTDYEGDTLYFQTNEDHWNIFVEYFVKKNGVWSEFDWEISFEPQCTDNYNGRFPILGDDNAETPLEGILRYGMTSAGFKFLFRNDTMKLRLQIKDRALNSSNQVETPEFVLRDITVEE
jgi:hypothetical protein